MAGEMGSDCVRHPPPALSDGSEALGCPRCQEPSCYITQLWKALTSRPMLVTQVSHPEVPAPKY